MPGYPAFGQARQEAETEHIWNYIDTHLDLLAEQYLDELKEKIAIAKDYAEILQYFSGTKEHRIRISPEALTMYNKWCADIEDMATNSREKSDTGILLGRLQTYVIKLAALIEIGKAERIAQIREINKLIKLSINKINDYDNPLYVNLIN